MAKGKATVKLLGVKKVMDNLNKEIRKIKRLSMQGLIESAYVIEREMDSTPPKIPVDQGNLRASRFVTTGTGNITEGQDAGNFKGDRGSEVQRDTSKAVRKAASKAAGAKNTNRPILIMGFGASYAGFVHESQGAKKWNREGSGPKFFETHLNNNQRTIINLIKANAKLK